MSNKNKLWKKVGKLAVEKAVETIVEEGVEASVEIWKKYRLKLQEEWFDKREQEREAAPKSNAVGEPASETKDEADQDADAETMHSFPEGTAASGANFDSFSEYLKRKKKNQSG